MNKTVVMGVAALTILVAVTGCNNKKQDTQTSMDANAVVSENVVSITEGAGNMVTDINALPVVVENGQVSDISDVAIESATGIVSDKPTPKNIQKALKGAGLYSGKVDGNIGPKTKKAIEEFQSQNGLKADGKVGPKTWKALSKYLGQTSEIENPTDQEQIIPVAQ